MHGIGLAQTVQVVSYEKWSAFGLGISHTAHGFLKRIESADCVVINFVSHKEKSCRRDERRLPVMTTVVKSAISTPAIYWSGKVASGSRG